MKSLSMLKQLWFFTLVLSTSSGYTQEISYNNIDFLDNPEWSDVLKLAENSGKIIFLDGYTSWCAPCKRMEKEVFTRARVANYFNQKFINVKYDMEAAEGMKLKKAYEVSVFPTYLFVNQKGKVVHKIVGAYTEKDDFLEYSMLAATPGESYADLQHRYNNGERNSILMFSYLRALKFAAETDKEKDIVDNYLGLMGKDHFMDPAYWDIIKHFMSDPLSKPFHILLENRAEIAAVNGESVVNDLVYKILSNQMKMNAAGYTKDGINFDPVAEKEFISLLKKYEFPRRNELLARSLIAQYHRRGEWSNYAVFMDAIVDFGLLKEHETPLREIDNFTNIFVNIILDETLLERALRWSEYTFENETKASERAKYLKTKAVILEKLGRKTEAEEAKVQASRLR
jgi:thioredoxin-related protein